MASETAPIEIFFFPFVGGGHQIPMIDAARAFASHGAKSTIVTTLSNSLQFCKSIARDQQSGDPIAVLTLQEVEVSDVDMSASPHTDTSALREPLRRVLSELRPDALVIDMFHRWANDAFDDLEIPRIVFNGSGCFPGCVFENLRRYAPHEKVGSDSELFIVPDLPDPIELTRSRLPPMARHSSGTPGPDRTKKSEDDCFGTVVNSFYELEPAYADYLRHVLKKKAWLVGPVSLCNKKTEDKAERGKSSTIDEQSCLNFLNSKDPNSVLYISFGSSARLSKEQLKEIAHALESCNCSFIWVVGKIFKSPEKSETEEDSSSWLPDGFEQRMNESNRGLIIRGWAPQLLILEHRSIGGFVTHCGWNSMLEGVCSGVPMVTWPLSAEQFSNEKLISTVLKVGAEVGSDEWSAWEKVVGREKVVEAVKKVLEKSEEAEEMRRRVRDIAAKARRAVEEGGSSYGDIEALIQELIARRQSRRTMSSSHV